MFSTQVVSSDSEVSHFIQNVLPSIREVSVDLEGDRLCRDGRISTIQIYIPDRRAVYVFDCHKLDKSQTCRSLKEMFASLNVIKYMFDCRADVDALYHQYGIQLENVFDVQLYENGARKTSGQYSKYYSGLFKTLQTYQADIGVSDEELVTKKKFSELFNSKKYEFSLSDVEFLNYLAIDVVYLHKLAELFHTRVGRSKVYQRILSETRQRTLIWQKPFFPTGPSKALSVI